MPNHLSSETSPYLLQHANNPVDWYPWSTEALHKARREDKPIFLSIGYAACHWCHVMAHESFENDKTAAILNESFISIKVDREERPDLDTIYMNAVVAMNGQGGWPMSVFLTPDLRPFFSGTYFPPTRRFGLPSFTDVLVSVRRAWNENRAEIDQAASQVTLRLAQLARWNEGQTAALNPAILESATNTLLANYDWQDGGWGRAPKFPQPMAIEFLLQQASRGNQAALKTAIHALKTMQRGGMYDWVGGGFHRYSTDNQWLIPHFEKMLYDNAQLALVYLHGYQLTGEDEFRQTCQDTLDFLLREMNGAEGGFFSSLDADSEGEEGKYYLWTQAEIESAIPSEEDRALFFRAYPLNPGGNFEGKHILQRDLTSKDLAIKSGNSQGEVQICLARCRRALLNSRQARIRPATDDKILTAWNGLALQAFAEAAAVLERDDYLQAARQNAAFLLSALHPKSGLLRSWRTGTARYAAYLEDFGALILGLLALYQADLNPDWYRASEELATEMVENFHDSKGGFFDTSNKAEELLMRPRNLQDNATPSGNALATLALLKLSAFNENSGWRSLAENNLSTVVSLAEQHPAAFAFWLQAASFALDNPQQIAFLFPEGDASHVDFLKAYRQTYHPISILAASSYPPAPHSPALLHNRTVLNNQPTVYICQNFTCQQPLTDLNEFKQLL